MRKRPSYSAPKKQYNAFEPVLYSRFCGNLSDVIVLKGDFNFDNSMPEPEYFECSCFSPEHHFFLSIDKEDKEIYLRVFLHNGYGFFKRCWVASKYIFGYKCRYGDWDEVIIKEKDVPRLIEFFKQLEE